MLVVDDEPRLRARAIEIFEGLGATVFEAYSAASAISVIRQHSEIELLFADVRLPGIGGVELASMAVSMLPDLRVILTSGYGEAQGRRDWRFVPKPWSPATIRGVVADALGRSW